ncbi:MAG: FAD:protein FMN transferase [Bacteroidales bacterium]
MRYFKLLLLVLIIPVMGACNRTEMTFNSFSGFTQGTTYSVIYENRKGTELTRMRSDIENLLREFDGSLSTYNPNSIISAINDNRDTVPDDFFIKVFNRSREIWEMSGGAFDITAGPLVNAWGFGPDALNRFDESKLDSLMDLVGMEKVNLENGKIVKSHPGMYLDVNAIAQGYSVDVLSEFLETKGIRNYLLRLVARRAAGTKAGAETSGK